MVKKKLSIWFAMERGLLSPIFVAPVFFQLILSWNSIGFIQTDRMKHFFYFSKKFLERS